MPLSSTPNEVIIATSACSGFCKLEISNSKIIFTLEYLRWLVCSYLIAVIQRSTETSGRTFLLINNSDHPLSFV